MSATSPALSHAAPTRPISTRLAPYAVAAAVTAAMVVTLFLLNRVWYCACGKVMIWSPDVWSSHCSQHLLDPYSITHVSHGLLFSVAFAWLLPKLPVGWRFALAIFIAAAWEVAENTPFVIKRYRDVTMSLDYLGDSILNSTADVGCCALGFVIAQRLGAKWTLLLFAAAELLLLWLIRDNLTLNVVMLIYPIQTIKQWQIQIAPPGISQPQAWLPLLDSAASSLRHFITSSLSPPTLPSLCTGPTKLPTS